MGFSHQVAVVPFDEVRWRLRVVGQSHIGVRPVEVERIVGSLDRSADFERDFSPRRGLSSARLASLEAAFPDGDMPPIAYFVSDGHHRVALARQRGAAALDGEVTRLHTNYELDQDVDVRRLVHTEQ
jgi:hypothetical protein